VSTDERALNPEDLTRMFIERANERDAAGIVAPYEEDAVMANPPSRQTVGRDAIRVLWKKVLANAPHFEQEPPLPTLISGDIALTSTPPRMAPAPSRRWLAGNPTARGCVCLTNRNSSHLPLAESSQPRNRICDEGVESQTDANSAVDMKSSRVIQERARHVLC
jgi:hypothetical protein